MRAPVWPVPSPAIFDAGESVAIEVDGTFGACALAQYLCVEDGDHEEHCKGEQQPPRRKGVAVEREPGGDQGCDDDEKADISEAAVHVFQSARPAPRGLAGASCTPLTGRGWREAQRYYRLR